MSEWKKTRLGEMLKVKKGQAITKRETHPGPYPVILGGQEPAYYIDRFNHTGKAIVISRSGASAGFVSFWDEPIFVTDGFLIEPKNNCTIDFLFYALKSKQGQLHNLQRGSAIPHVTPALFGEVETLLPPRHIQDRIAGILSDYDSAIANCRKQIVLLEEAAMRLYREWFKDGKGEKKRIGDIVKIKRGKVITKATATIGSIPVIAAGLEPAYFTDKHNVDAPCITISASGANAGHVALHHENIWASDCSYVSHKETPYIFFIYELLKDKAIAIRQLQKGSAQPHVHASDVERIEMVMPSEQQLKEYEQKVAALFWGIRNLHSQIRTLTEARDRLLPKLMKGEVAV